MKKSILLLVVLLSLTIVSCSDDCDKDALCTFIKRGHSLPSSKQSTDKKKVFVCHNQNTIEINKNALKAHLNHGDTEGPCKTLSSNGLEFSDGDIVKISCEHELPFMYIKDNGEQWLYSRPY